MIRIGWLIFPVILLVACNLTPESSGRKHETVNNPEETISILSPDVSPCVFLNRKDLGRVIGVSSDEIYLHEKDLTKFEKSCVASWLIDSIPNATLGLHYRHYKETSEIEYRILSGELKPADWAPDALREKFLKHAEPYLWEKLAVLDTDMWWNEGESLFCWTKNNDIHCLSIRVPLLEADRKSLAVELASRIQNQS